MYNTNTLLPEFYCTSKTVVKQIHNAEKEKSHIGKMLIKDEAPSGI